MRRGPDRQAAGGGLETEGTGERHGCEIRVGGEKGGQDLRVFVAAEGARRIDEPPAGADVRGELREQGLLDRRRAGDAPGRRHPLEVRRAPPRARAAARRIDQYAIVKAKGLCDDGDAGGP